MTRTAPASRSVPPLAGNPAVTTVEPYNVIMAVLEGLPAGGSYGAMPSFAGRLSDEQIAELTNYVRTSWGNQAAPNATAEMIGAWRAVATVPAYGFPPVEMVWAVPAGSWLVAREPSGFTGKLSCPADDGKLVPTALVAKAAALLGTPQPPVPGATAAQLASSFATQNAKSAPADIANALIAAYCRIVSPEASVADAEKLSWLETFGDQVIDTLQLRLAARHQ
jgi:hypothetical protein